MTEPDIIINGRQLTQEEARTVYEAIGDTPARSARHKQALVRLWRLMKTTPRPAKVDQ